MPTRNIVFDMGVTHLPRQLSRIAFFFFSVAEEGGELLRITVSRWCIVYYLKPNTKYGVGRGGANFPFPILLQQTSNNNNNF